MQTRNLVTIAVAVVSAACIESMPTLPIERKPPRYIEVFGEPDGRTPLGIPYYLDDDLTHIPDYDYTDRAYEAVCDCVGVDPDGYVGQFAIQFENQPVTEEGIGVGGRYWTGYRLIEMKLGQWSMAHELGHFFTDVLIGYSKTDDEAHLPWQYESLCADSLRPW